MTLNFILALAAFFFQGAYFSGVHLYVFAPFVALVTLSQKELWKALFLAAFVGALSDLFSDHPIGSHAIACSVASFLLWQLRNRFLLEKPLHFGLFTALTSFSISHLLIFLLFLFDRRIPFAGKWGFGDFLGMPLADGIFGLIWYAAPLYLIQEARRMWKLFWLKRKILSQD
jgi:rod shape-determining protein MreD